MNIAQACADDAPLIAEVLKEAADWLIADGRPLWSATEIGEERVRQDLDQGLFHVARDSGAIAGVLKFELEDPRFWPEVTSGTSAFVHKLAIRRSWAKKGVSSALLSYAHQRTRHLGRTYLRLDCVADRQGLRRLYEGFGFSLHSVVQIGSTSFARYEIQLVDT
ncbi:MAG: GNAT family N-acetyltransferase [Proteobacteria bacterium]|nr:GNAT family N-acetyltransferase [Pseudomonadota bacterium]